VHSDQPVRVTLVNSTVSGNRATFGDDRGAAGFGGGVRFEASGGVLEMVGSTVYGNSASHGAQLYARDLTAATILVAGSLFGGGATGTTDCDFGGSAVAPDASVAQDDTCRMPASGDLRLGALASNGGLTPTHALLAGSPAIGAGACAARLANGHVLTLAVDQRGVARPLTTGCDAGAYEYVAPAPWPFSGFLAPLDGGGTHAAKAGGAVPVKFTLGTDRGLAIFAPGSPSSRPVACEPGDAAGEAVATLTAGNSTLSYDAATGQYAYVWKTDRGWGGTCRELRLAFADGTSHTARFRFTR
jgi:hypothetical protein